MRALRVVGITEGGGELSVVLEDPSRRERFTVPADEQLRAAARGDLTRLGQISIELESQLRPREIQARIRAGASVEQVAAAAGVPLQKIERFAYPVLLERSRTAEVAQRAHPMRADGPDTRTLGEVVAHTFGLRGQDYADAEWDSWKGEDGKWVVALSWRAGRSDNRAHWTFQPGAHGGTVTAVDEHASDLIEGLPARPLRTVGPVIDIARPEDPAPAPGPQEELRAAASDTIRGAARDHTSAADARTAERTTPRSAREPRRPTPPTQRQAPVAPPRTAPFRPESGRADDARPERARQEPARPAQPTRPAQPDRGRTEPDPVEAPAARDGGTARPEHDRPARDEGRQPSARRSAARADAPRTEPVPAAKSGAAASAPAEEPAPAAADRPAADTTAADTPATPERPAAEQQAPAPSKRTKKGKPVMPSWDEVLLGVRGQH
jgi:hypothetical protein